MKSAISRWASDRDEASNAQEYDYDPEVDAIQKELGETNAPGQVKLGAFYSFPSELSTLFNSLLLLLLLLLLFGSTEPSTTQTLSPAL